MIIRQESMISFTDYVEMKTRQGNALEKVFSALPMDELESLLSSKRRKGPAGYAPISLFLGLIAMRVMKIPYVADLVRQLEMNPALRWMCGFSVMGRAPSEATYSRFIKRLSQSRVTQQLFEKMVSEQIKDIPGENIAIDSSAVEARENSFAKEARRKKDAPAYPDKPSWGVKSGTPLGRGKSHWYGWKLHLAVDADTGFPLAFHVTTASVHDTKPANLLCEKAHTLLSQRPRYYLLDKSYDTEAIHLFIREQLSASPIIPLQQRRNPTPAPDLDKRCAPVCSMGYSMIYWGFDGRYHKFRCPHVLNKLSCPMGSDWCSSSNYGLVVKQNLAQDPRKFGFPHRCSRSWNNLYKKRNQVERCFALLKSFFSLNLLSHRGLHIAETMFALSLVALLASW